MPVVMGRTGVTGGVVGAGEAVVGAGLLVLLADLAGQAERGGVLGAGIAGEAGGEEHFAQAVECLGFTGPFADLTEQGQGLLVAVDRTLQDHGLADSMGRVGACGDNAAMESFFALLQKNVLDRQRWSDREQLRLPIITWIERTYHRRRRQRRLGRLTPIEYETINTAAHAA